MDKYIKMLDKLFVDIYIEIFKYLDLNDILNVSRLSKKVHRNTIELKYSILKLDICDRNFNSVMKNTRYYEYVQHIRISTKRNKKFREMAKKFINLKTLQFGKYFGIEIDELANKFNDLRVLDLGPTFNKKIDAISNSFPNLEVLNLGWRFDHKIDTLANSFPKLRELDLGGSFNRNIDSLANSFPRLQKLILSDKFTQDISNLVDRFPKLEVLYLSENFDKSTNAFTGSFWNLRKLGMVFRGNIDAIVDIFSINLKSELTIDEMQFALWDECGITILY